MELLTTITYIDLMVPNLTKIPIGSDPEVYSSSLDRKRERESVAGRSNGEERKQLK